MISVLFLKNGLIFWGKKSVSKRSFILPFQKTIELNQQSQFKGLDFCFVNLFLVINLIAKNNFEPTKIPCSRIFFIKLGRILSSLWQWYFGMSEVF